MMSLRVYDSFIKSGWFIGRKINRKKIVETIIQNNLSLLENVVNFLEEFGNLKLYFHNKRNGINDDINFIYNKAMDIEVFDRVETYEERIKKKMCIIGTVYRDNMVLLMAYDSCIYVALDDELYFIASNPFEAIDSIFDDLHFTPIL